MKTWHYSINSYHKHGTVECINQPWWLAMVEWFSDYFPPEWMYKIKLPNFPKRQWDQEDELKHTPREYWGTFGDFLCYRALNPLMQWIYNHPKRNTISVELGYERLKKFFYEDSPEFFDTEDKHAQEMIEEWGEP